MSGDVLKTTTSQTASSSSDSDFGYEDLVAGCALAIGGNLLISVSLNLQKYTHMQNAQADTQEHYTKKPIWWLGLSLMAAGEIGNFVAYGYAPASLVAPLGTTTVIVNAFIAVMALNEELRTEDMFGGSLAVIGAFLLINFSSKTEKVYDADGIIYLLQGTAFIVYIVIEVCILAGTLFVAYYLKVQSVVVLLLACNVIASFTVIAAKAVSSMLQLTLSGDMQLTSWVFWFMLIGMAIAVVIQLKFLNQSMQLYESSIVVPTNFVFFTISAILAGVIFYKEFYGLSAVDVLMFIYGCLMCFIGVYFITIGRTAVVEVELSLKEAELDKERLATVIFPSWIFPSILRAEAPLKRSNFQRSNADLTDGLPEVYTDAAETTATEVTPEINIATELENSINIETELQNTLYMSVDDILSVSVDEDELASCEEPAMHNVELSSD
ncbi:hypothetical protein CAPTEDRAFT_228824 [Capitella teleta]|uniref:NIPA-like protein 2 n=1 Tax=Capitella teleta TaxID=283909 RepID=R7THL2_CAPTE|nr:hypothetical protein CAPTEDRAFT_228824 [Capitella teleta]|eukprot:ELT93209.1 hypothetical protein CAPTEDRAFT_228824 [Capitella teleta]